MTSKEKAQMGLSQLEEAILEVLYRADRKKEPLQPHEISKDLGIPSLKGKSSRDYGIVYNVLVKLEIDERVERVKSKKRSDGKDWQLTESELSEQDNTN